jgi:hypothetical protein
MAIQAGVHLHMEMLRVAWPLAARRNCGTGFARTVLLAGPNDSVTPLACR